MMSYIKHRFPERGRPIFSYLRATGPAVELGDKREIRFTDATGAEFFDMYEVTAIETRFDKGEERVTLAQCGAWDAEGNWKPDNPSAPIFTHITADGKMYGEFAKEKK